MLVARAGDGSMRDAQSALDQVIAFAGSTITADDVTTVLGLVRRDLLITIADAIAREDATAAFELAGRAVEAGYDLRLVIRELARLTRDLLVLTVDPSRASDPEIAADAEREPLLALAGQFSREDLMRAFDVLTKAELDIRSSMQPRYHLEMALLRLIHLRKLVPLSDLIEQMKGSAPSTAAGPNVRSGGPRVTPGGPAETPTRPAPIPVPGAARASTVKAVEAKRAAVPTTGHAQPSAAAATDSPAPLGPVDPAELKNGFLEEIRKSKRFFYGTVVAQAQRIEFEGDKVVFMFGPQHRALKLQLEQSRAWLESTASQLAGRRVTLVSAEGTAPAAAPSRDSGGESVSAADVPDRQQALKQQAMADSGVQTLLDVFAAEIKDVEKM
jgi:DNA polymerase-3 subunit gamma/tau